MPRVHWQLQHGRPRIEIELTRALDNQPLTRHLLADSGAGSLTAGFDLVLDENDCLICGCNPDQAVTLRGAFSGSFPTYVVAVRIPALGFSRNLRAVAVPAAPTGLDGIACFRFLNRFTYGNFGDHHRFGLES